MRTFLLPVFILFFFILIGWLFYRNNLHTVISGQVYRSAQLSPGHLAFLIEKYQIHSVVNLRGENLNQDWFLKERELTQRLGIEYYNISMSADRVAQAAYLSRLLHIFQTAPRPLLIHCQAGADRTGLASSVALIVDKNTDLNQAKRQFSWLYHVFNPYSTGKLTFPYYEKWLRERGLDSSAFHFITWVNQLKPEFNYPE